MDYTLEPRQNATPNSGEHNLGKNAKTRSSARRDNFTFTAKKEDAKHASTEELAALIEKENKKISRFIKQKEVRESKKSEAERKEESKEEKKDSKDFKISDYDFC